MPESNEVCWTKRHVGLVIGAFTVCIALAVGTGLLLLSIQQRKIEAQQSAFAVVEIGENELDPEVWGRNFPRQLSSFLKLKDSSVETPYGGSVPYSKLERYPAMKRIWAGYAFSIDHNEERGHAYALQDQKATQRVAVKEQPGACANCHAAEAPQLIAKMGWEEFNRTPYSELKHSLHTDTSCADCHAPNTMELRITRPAFKNAMEERGIDLSKATRQEMRSYVCAQCHVEYYFKGENQLLTFPWKKGLTIDDMEAVYDELGFSDWTHKETGAKMIKIQHPEFELANSGLHLNSGVACADCHMPYMRDGAVKVSDHWIRSPLTNLNKSCQPCHKQDEAELKNRVDVIQNRTAKLLRETEDALIDCIDAIVAAQKSGATDEELKEARHLHRRSSLRWDFISSENSTGFHAPQESARVLADAINFARQGQLSAVKVTKK